MENQTKSDSGDAPASASTAGAAPEAADREACLRPTWFIDSDSPRVMAYAKDAIDGARDDREKAVRLFYKVRDGIRYDPYVLSPERRSFKASVIADVTAAFCVPKAILLTAAGRASGVPSRLGFGDVRNHLSSAQLRKRLGTDLFVFHGWTEFLLDGRWVKATPAFNRGLCERFGVSPLEFDGRTDCLYQPYDLEGRRHMEYVHIRGAYADLPFEEMIATFKETYGSVRPAQAGPRPSDPVFD